MDQKINILQTQFVTHDVKRFVLQKPKGFKFVPGQATELSIDLDGWRKEKRPFTFTSLNKDLVLEFTIKKYPEHRGVTQKLHQLQPGDKIILRQPWGTINFAAKGVFIAGGAGITPFIAILRQLKDKGEIKGNKLIFSNKLRQDIILEKEWQSMFKPEDLSLVLTREKHPDYYYGRITKKFLQNKIKDFRQKFYVCGPKPMVKDITSYLKNLGADTNSIVIEE